MTDPSPCDTTTPLLAEHREALEEVLRTASEVPAARWNEPRPGDK